jgi:uncharacterized protein (TIRG00374 family)
MMHEMHKWVRPTALVALAAMAGYAMLLTATDGDRTLAALNHIESGGLAVVLALVVCGYTVRFVRWDAYARCEGFRLPLGPHFLYYLAGFAWSATPGKAGEMVKSLYLRPHGVPYSTSIGMFFSERLVDVWVMVCLALMFVLDARDYALPAIGMVIAMTGALVWLFRSNHLDAVSGWMGRRRSERVRSVAEGVLAVLRAARRLLVGRTLWLGGPLGFLAWGLEGIAFYLLLAQFGLVVSPTVAMGIFAVSMLVGALSFLPGGIGGTEAVMGLLLVAAGANIGDSLVIVIVFRIATLWFAMLLGIIATVVLRLQRGAWFPA